MIMYDNLIMGGGEITAQGTFKTDSGAFYLFIVPKSESAASIAVLNVKLSRNKQNTDYPFVAGIRYIIRHYIYHNKYFFHIFHILHLLK